MRRLFFDHVPKCGGLAFREYLQEIYGEASVTPEGGFVSYRNALEIYGSFDAIAVHVWHEPLEAFAPDRHHVTILRNPLSRVLSHIEFAAHDIDVLGHGFIQKVRTMGAEGVLLSDDDDVLTFTSNLMTRHFSQILWDGQTRLTDEQQLANALQALEKYDLVGVQEELDDCAATLACQLGARAVEQLPVVNATSVSKPTLSSQTARRIEQLNALDTELWEHAKKLFRTQRRRVIVASANAVPAATGAATANAVPAVIQKSDAPVRPVPLSAKARFGTREIEFASVNAVGGLSHSPAVLCGDALVLRLVVRSHIVEDDATIGFSIARDGGEYVFGTNTRLLGCKVRFEPGRSYSVEFAIPNQLGLGKYCVNVAAHRGASHLSAAYDIWEDATRIAVVGNIGLHFEGAFKLYPAVSVTFRDGPSPAPGWISTGRHEFQRLGVVNPAIEKLDYRITASDAPDKIGAKEVFILPLVLHNAGNNAIPGIGTQAVYVSYHWRTATGELAPHESKRSSFARNLEPHGSCTVHATIVGPTAPGTYLLDLCLVQDSVKWFDDEALVCRLPISVSVTV